MSSEFFHIKKLLFAKLQIVEFLMVSKNLFKDSNLNLNIFLFKILPQITKD